TYMIGGESRDLLQCRRESLGVVGCTRQSIDGIALLILVNADEQSVVVRPAGGPTQQKTAEASKNKQKWEVCACHGRPPLFRAERNNGGLKADRRCIES